jgi:hypothetical protein
MAVSTSRAEIDSVTLASLRGRTAIGVIRHQQANVGAIATFGIEQWMMARGDCTHLPVSWKEIRYGQKASVSSGEITLLLVDDEPQIRRVLQHAPFDP